MQRKGNFPPAHRDKKRQLGNEEQEFQRARFLQQDAVPNATTPRQMQDFSREMRLHCLHVY